MTTLWIKCSKCIWFVIAVAEMTPQELHKVCAESIAEGYDGINLVFDKVPKSFPRGELLCETPRGKVYSHSAIKVLAWMQKNNLLLPMPPAEQPNTSPNAPGDPQAQNV